MAKIKKQPKQKVRKPSWRDYNDALFRIFPSLPQPESLHPNEYTMIRAAMGEEEATAITASWQLVVPVRVVEVLQ